MTTWDDVRPILHAIEGNAERACNAGAMAAKLTAHLPAKPEFETRAAESLALAETELRLALASVKAARERFENLPIDSLPIAAE
jgi:hypothetical protein